MRFDVPLGGRKRCMAHARSLQKSRNLTKRLSLENLGLLRDRTDRRAAPRFDGMELVRLRRNTHLLSRASVTLRRSLRVPFGSHRQKRVFGPLTIVYWVMIPKSR